MGLIIYANTGTSDLELNASGSEWTMIDPDNDRIIFSAGSDSIDDGEASPSDIQLNQAGVLLTGLEQTISKYFLDDDSASILKQIHNMGAGNYRYVWAFDFDQATNSEPVLEIWDDDNFSTIDNICLGEGTPSSSWFRGIVTTDALPGIAWTGSRIAGSSDGHFLWLNDENGPLAVAGTLYCQMKVVIPASVVEAGAEAPVLVVKYA